MLKCVTTWFTQACWFFKSLSFHQSYIIFTINIFYQKKCEGMDGYLVEIGSSDENAWILNFIRKGYLYDPGKKNKS